MLRELTIRNFAIIDDLTIGFQPGLTILSGETGAGKSIVINAVNLLLGSRASDRLVRTGADSAELEALFEVPPESPVARLMTKNEFDPGEGLMIRRIISAGGRNRVYINSRLATMKLLNDLTGNLASISGQHAHQGLLNEEGHLDILDQFGGLMPLREKVRNRHGGILPLLEKLKALRSKKDRQSEQIDLLRFQREEIQAAAVEPGEDEALEGERRILKNAETLYRIVYEGVEALYNAEDAVAARLSEAARGLEKACEIDPGLTDRTRSVADAAFQIEDIAEGLRSYLQTVRIDEGRLEEIESRLDALQKLKRKYGGSLADVLAKLASIEAELSSIENIDEEIAGTEATLAERHRDLAALAEDLSVKRKETARTLAEKVEAELDTLKMADTRFEVVVEPLPAGEGADPWLTTGAAAIGPAGADRARFMIAPNVGEALKPLSAIASGGELSRVVLALKAILAQTESVETVIFDEVDAGVGGGVAEVVGRKLASLADFHQIVCITHLPQIAKFAGRHFRISKGVEGGRTRTTIVPLDEAERVQEIARMLGGVEVTQTTLDHAREMLQGA
jgi:DNA repair protein RecN (Recombination protein N)